MKNYVIFTNPSGINPHIYTYGIKYDDHLIEDISTDKNIVLNMCDIFNRANLSPIHFKDAVEDFMVILDA